MLQTSIAVIALAGTIFAHPLGMLISTGHDLIIEIVHLIEHLKNGEYQKAMEDCLGIINNALYLALFLHGGLEIGIASLAMQILIGLYHSQAEFKEGHYIEGTGHLLMSMVRGNQLGTNVKILQFQNKLRSVLKDAHVKNTCSQRETARPASVKVENGKSYRIDAYKVEKTLYDGCYLHCGYYTDGTVILTVVHDTKGRVPDGRQGIGDQSQLYIFTDHFVFAVINGINYVRHIYVGGANVYSTEYSQFATIN